MRDYNDERYEPLRDWMKRARNNGIPWEDIRFKINSDSQESDFFEYNIENNFWPDDSPQAWLNIAEGMFSIELGMRKASEIVEKSTILGHNQKNALDAPQEKDSSWYLYKQRLEEKGFKNIETIEAECLNILQNLNSDTKDEPVKGMVVGNVQSGKTANMTGLIAMAADHGWNLFIVLSGTIDSLRVQTRERMYNDLHNNHGKLKWYPIDHLNLKNPEIGRAHV